MQVNVGWRRLERGRYSRIELGDFHPMYQAATSKIAFDVVGNIEIECSMVGDGSKEAVTFT